MSAKEKGRPASDAGLSKQRVTAEAVLSADSEGVEGWCMRRLAYELGAVAKPLND